MPAGAVDAIKKAFAEWENVSTAGISFSFVVENASTPPPSVSNEGTNAIIWVTSNWTHGSNIAAYTTTHVSGVTGEIQGADMEFNGTPGFTQNNPWSANAGAPDTGTLDIQNMATHEVGHFVGIDHHTINTDATMYNIMVKEETKKRSLHQDDIDAVSFLYSTTSVSIEIVSGNNQQGLHGTQLPTPLSVRVRDSADDPLPNAFVIFDTTDGTLQDTDPLLTDVNGIAQTTLTLPWSARFISIRAAAAGLQEVTFTAESTNTTPVLAWTNEPSYISDGLDPETGYSATDFVFRIKYTDADNDAPAVARVWIDLDGDDSFVPTEKFDMVPGSSNYSSGVIYSLTTNIPFSAGSSNCKYYFEFNDGTVPAGGITSAISSATSINAPDVLQTLGVNITSATWALGIVEANTVHQSTAFEVTNSGDGVETFTLQIGQEAQSWNAGSSNGSETYVLKGLFGDLADSAPTGSKFDTNDVISGTEVNAGSTTFGDATLTATGQDVPSSGQRTLWLQFTAPADTSENGGQTVGITVGAQP